VLDIFNNFDTFDAVFIRYRTFSIYDMLAFVVPVNK